MLKRRSRLLGRFAMAIVAILVVWFAAIRESVYVEACVHCGSLRTTTETRLFGLLVSHKTQSARDSFVSQVATDLGMPCPHTFERGLYARRYGLVWSVCYHNDWMLHPLAPGVVPEWYAQNTSRIIGGLKKDGGRILNDFSDKAIMNFDRDYWHRLCDRMEELCQQTTREKHDVEQDDGRSIR